MAHKGKKALSRRNFLLGTAGGAVAFSAAPMFVKSAAAAGYAGGTKVHPNVDDLRVVGIHDETMIKGNEGRLSWYEQEKQVNKETVQANLDRMACALAKEKDPQKAWKAIFVKPPGKSWSDVTVAIKSNHICQQRARSAVMSKICHVFTGILGAKGSNIFIYDGCHGAHMSKRTPFRGLPDGVHLANKWGSYNTPVTIPAPYLGGSEKRKCLGHLVKDKVDILVDLALCKGHNISYLGGFTMCMKNHFGTCEPRPGHDRRNGLDYLLGMNQIPHIMGKMDKKGRILFPRQQLCLVDALWGSKPGPCGDSTHQLNRMYMGVLAPVMDYQVSTKLREKTLGWRINKQAVEKFLPAFGFKTEDLPENGEIVDAMKYTA